MAQPGRKREVRDREADGGRGKNVNQVVKLVLAPAATGVSVSVKPLGAIWSN